ncbi:hypothetical protein H4R34_002657 [Dimargaris verticillata]|uniref:Bromo domain-containing protein n=1 Tax=Dimargaris verticillata TaxID=2761393 RepID=A0A9W8B7M8_9FUNG|nr:hypothetical protein H4R34_002657 [Dimargaris verticillata]
MSFHFSSRLSTTLTEVCTMHEHRAAHCSPSHFSTRDNLLLLYAILRHGLNDWTKVADATVESVLKITQPYRRMIAEASQGQPDAAALQMCESQFRTHLAPLACQQQYDSLVQEFSRVAGESQPDSSGVAERLAARVRKQYIEELEVQAQQNREEFKRMISDMKTIKQDRVETSRLKRKIADIMSRRKKRKLGPNQYLLLTDEPDGTMDIDSTPPTLPTVTKPATEQAATHNSASDAVRDRGSLHTIDTALLKAQSPASSPVAAPKREHTDTAAFRTPVELPPKSPLLNEPSSNPTVGDQIAVQDHSFPNTDTKPPSDQGISRESSPLPSPQADERLPTTTPSSPPIKAEPAANSPAPQAKEVTMLVQSPPADDRTTTTGSTSLVKAEPLEHQILPLSTKPSIQPSTGGGEEDDEEDDELADQRDKDRKQKNWKKLIGMIWREIANHRAGSFFAQPIRAQDAPGYYDIIKKPIDLKAIRLRIRDEKITTTDEFHRDILHMLQNALMYNAEDSEVYQMTLEMLDAAENDILTFKNSEAFSNRPPGTIL